MPRFAYIAIDHRRKTARGTVTAENPYAARKHLRTKGLHPTEIKEVGFEDEARSLGGLLRRGSKRQITEFTTQMSTMLSAGIKLTEALAVLIQQIGDQRFRSAITDVRDRVVTGESFADALSEYTNYFDVIYISLIRVGEVTGTLSQSLSKMASFMEKRQRLESKMATAMIYPALLLSFCIIVSIVLTVVVIPKIAEQFEKVGQTLPWITRALVKVSEIMTNFWWMLGIILILIVFVFSLRQFLKTRRGAYLRDKMLLSLPVFGRLLKQRIAARFTSTLSTLLSSGLSMADSLKVVAEVTGNVIMADAVRQARDRILSGADIATPLRDSGVIDPTIAHMVTVGERSGELGQMLQHISENLESSSDVVIDRLSAAMEPVIILVMAVLVGVIAVAAFLPIIRYTSGQFGA
ncbi:MAG: type II secretion system F family protein [Sedimentisphaerales bacterium]|nr:type II secretion system F family protein [Sedimentisphaerales bacterium]